ncbi:RNA polymerase sigma factor RpoE [Psychromonas antarctica]|jgi:RNA polymerase sigma-70 factor (ECF subfamily)|uniref:RNA polymerase sigma factor RpoE n=1 Tax=Psychromonas antarctica TaxID=67573 RepID=UPI001EE8AD55|nr:RNA polymerase sigma factor RpoE [Psychromonas antarctica]MCG6201489.1 RNA polymerase sigma factor RpoE [Psychromonas antarctica]
MNERDLDFQLIQRIQNGEQQAFTLLVKKYQNRVANILTRYVRNNGDIADVAQEVFIKVFNSLPSFRGDSAFYTWLYRITVNTAKNYLTSQGRRPPASDIDAMEADSYDGSDALKESDDPEGILRSQEIKNVILDTIKLLPVELKSAITLRELEGMSYEEIATIEDCPIGTVRSRIYRAREAIDKQLKPLLED